jgi:hypothetical protein
LISETQKRNSTSQAIPSDSHIDNELGDVIGPQCSPIGAIAHAQAAIMVRSAAAGPCAPLSPNVLSLPSLSGVDLVHWRDLQYVP